MSKASKRRMCPALGREITAGDCGDNRHSRYACPLECPHSPFAPSRYDDFLALEEVVDGKAMSWWKDTAKDSAAQERGMQKAMNAESGHALHAFVAWQIFFQRDDAGLTCAQRWAEAGFPGLKNDERVLVQAKLRLRTTHLEVRRVLDHERSEVVDLLEPDSEPRLFLDRSFAGTACRFTTLIGWIYPLPHFWRLFGTAIVIPDWGPFEPTEVVTELVRHLGGPTAAGEMPRWLAEHFVRFDEALEATSEARHRDMLAAMDAQFGKAVYQLHAPFGECCCALDAEDDVDEDNLTPAERREGFAEARVWLEPKDTSVLALPDGGQMVLGRILLGQTFWRLEAIGQERLNELRQRFEALLGPRIKFAGERRDDMSDRLTTRNLGYDPALVPPRLREHPQRVHLGASRAPAPAAGETSEDYEARLFAAQDRAFPDQSVPALDGKTPREAARDPVLRLKLIRLMKSRIRAQDENNLRKERRDDINWLLRELGLDELLVEPPPPRPRLDSDDSDEPEESRPAPPPLPARALSRAEAAERLHAAVAGFETAAAAMKEMEASGSTLLADVHELAADILSDREFSLAITFLIQAWFALVPPGSAAPELDFDRLADAFRAELEGLQRGLQGTEAKLADQVLDGCRQPALTHLLFARLLEVCTKMPKNQAPGHAEKIVMGVLLKTAINEIDLALRG